MESHRMEIFVTMISASTGYEELEVSFFRKFWIQNNGNVRLSIVLWKYSKKSHVIFSHVTYSGKGVAFLVAKWLEFWNKPRSGYKNQLSIFISFVV